MWYPVGRGKAEILNGPKLQSLHPITFTGKRKNPTRIVIFFFFFAFPSSIKSSNNELQGGIKKQLFVLCSSPKSKCYICVFTSIAYVDIYTCVCIYKWIYAQVYIHMICTYTCMHIPTYIHMHTYMFVYVCMCREREYMFLKFPRKSQFILGLKF